MKPGLLVPNLNLIACVPLTRSPNIIVHQYQVLNSQILYYYNVNKHSGIIPLAALCPQQA